MFDPVRVCQILNEEAVDYIVIGGVAAAAHGSSLTTRDIDVMPSTELENLERLASALTRIHAHMRTESDPVPVNLDGRFLQGVSRVLNLTTDCGDVGVVFDTEGIDGGFPAWNRVQAGSRPSQGSCGTAVPRIPTRRGGALGQVQVTAGAGDEAIGEK